MKLIIYAFYATMPPYSIYFYLLEYSISPTVDPTDFIAHHVH